jgi:ABC-type uncharacterized transport system substrate-binding protein
MKLFPVVVAMILLYFPAISGARQQSIDIVFCNGPGTGSRREIISELSNRYPTRYVDCASTVPTETQLFVALSYADVVDILSNAHLASSPAVISNVYRDSISDIPAARHRSNMYTFFNDPDPRSQLLLSKAIFPHLPRFLLMYTQATRSIAVEYDHAALSLGVQLQLTEVSDEKGALRAIRDYQDADAIVLIPDKTLYNKDTLPNIIRASYQLNIPLVGFSAGLVRSGVLGTTYPSIDSRVEFISRVIDHYRKNQDNSRTVLDDHRHSLVINRKVARSLNITIVEDDILMNSIQGEGE